MTSFLHSRGIEITTAIVLFIFVSFNIFVEVPVCLGINPAPDSSFPITKLTYWWTSFADRIFIAQPLWSRVANCYHCFGFGPLYFYLALGFLYRWNSIRLVGIATGAAKLYAGALYIAANVFDPIDFPHCVSCFLFQSSWYMIFPAFILYRCWQGEPFAKTRAPRARRN